MQNLSKRDVAFLQWIQSTFDAASAHQTTITMVDAGYLTPEWATHNFGIDVHASDRTGDGARYLGQDLILNMQAVASMIGKAIPFQIRVRSWDKFLSTCLFVARPPSPCAGCDDAESDKADVASDVEV